MSAISQLPTGTPTLASLFEIATAASGGTSASVTMAQMLALVPGNLTIAGKVRIIPGYGVQYYDPATPTHPWRSQIIALGVLALEIGIPDVAPAIPVLNSASFSAGANHLSFGWTDGTYGGTGNLEIWKNGSLLSTIGNAVVTFNDGAGIVGDIYQVRWTNGTYGSTLSNSITAA